MIGIDLDGTITDFGRRIGQIYHERKRMLLHLEDWTKYPLTHLGFSKKEAREIESDPDTFKYMVPYWDFEEYGKELIKEYNCPIITSRGMFPGEKNPDPAVMVATYDWMQEYDIAAKVVFTRNKGRTVEKLGLIGLIDDSPDHLLACGGYRVCRAQPYNRHLEGRMNLRTDSWKRIARTITELIEIGKLEKKLSKGVGL